MATNPEGVGGVVLALGEDVNGVYRPLELTDQGAIRIDGRWSIAVQKDEAVDDSDKTLTVPADTEWEVQAIHAQVDTSATAGSRQLVVQFLDDVSDLIMEVVAGATQGANQTRFYEFAPHLEHQTGFQDTDKLTDAIPKLMLGAGYQIRVFDNTATDPTADDVIVRVLTRTRSA